MNILSRFLLPFNTGRVLQYIHHIDSNLDEEVGELVNRKLSKRSRVIDGV